MPVTRSFNNSIVWVLSFVFEWVRGFTTMNDPGYSNSKVFVHSSYCNGHRPLALPNTSSQDSKDAKIIDVNSLSQFNSLHHRLIHPSGTKSENNILRNTMRNSVNCHIDKGTDSHKMVNSKVTEYKENELNNTIMELNLNKIRKEFDNNSEEDAKINELEEQNCSRVKECGVQNGVRRPQEFGSGNEYRRLKAIDFNGRGYDSDDSSLSSVNSGPTQNGDRDALERRRWAPRWVQWRGPARVPTRRPRAIAPDRYLAAAYPFRAKCPPPALLNGSKWDILSQEMWDLFASTQQTEETFRKKLNLWRFLYVSIKSIFPRYGLYLVGSTMSGFGLDNSDVDLCLYVRALDYMDPRAHAIVHLGLILSYLRSFDSVLVNTELIPAKVPILKFRDSRHGIDVDLNCNNVVGIRNTNLLYCYSQLDWRVRPLVLVVKLWARSQNINDARNRTVSSYALTLMVIHYLQCGVSPAVLPCLGTRDTSCPPCVPPSENNMSLGELFLDLLHYFATFPYEGYAISVRCGRRLPVDECRAARAFKNDPHQWKLMCVEEPFELTNTARSVYDPDMFNHILTVFRNSHTTLSRSLRLRDVV